MIALLVLTGQRKTEIGHLRWEEIHGNCINLSVDRTKNHRLHRLPLPPSALGILESRDGTSTFVFPGKNTEKPFNGIRKVKEALDKAVGIEHFTLHDLRRTLSSNMARLGVPIQVTEKILNHQSGSFGGVAGIYNRHSYHEEMREALCLYDSYLENLINS